MRVGATIFNQNYGDWDRYEAEERGEEVPSRAVRPDREVFAEELEIARIADEVGFDSVWTIEHHFTPYTMVTNPLQYLTYVAAITKKVDLGTMVTVLPWHNPVRVAEDINMLDTFLGPDRKVICGVGRGLGRREYGGLGIDQNEARGRFDEGIQILQKLLRDGRLERFEGRYFDVRDVRLRPQPDRDMSDSLWCAGGTEQTMQTIARLGVNPLTIPTTSIQEALDNIRAYARLRRASGFTPARTKLALWTYVAETHDEADAACRRYMVEYADSALRHYEILGTHLGKLKGYETYGAISDALRGDAGETFRRGQYDTHPWGTPDEVIRMVTERAEAFGADEIMFVFKYGSMPIDVAEKSIRLFASDVMPALRKLDPAPLSGED
jgi:alkanesulfonate monooxygenase SsuD/methylene tetrahydromethanopterin reductase-like flavin-dependent oxidoreductase (luciferase family)